MRVLRARVAPPTQRGDAAQPGAEADTAAGLLARRLFLRSQSRHTLFRISPAVLLDRGRHATARRCCSPAGCHLGLYGCTISQRHACPGGLRGTDAQHR